ncbi:MAG TPA: DJ-1/PfpI family protein, partial [Candidatus Ozemobacteraceae bacterium]|nr:DJ-1/PfpI family protein [Candidatus Ozemobacteraceae bacterium]
MVRKTVIGFMVLCLVVLGVLPVSAYEVVKPEEVDAGMPYEVKQVPVENPLALHGLKVALVAAHGFEEVEATYPIEFLVARGAVVDVITPDWIKDRVMAVRFLKPSVWIPVTKQISQARMEDYAAIIVPGGAWNPIIMRTDTAILDFVRRAHSAGVLVASICHGPQVLLSAGLLSGKEVTGVGDIRQDLRNAGAHVHEDRPVVIDGNLLTSRDPHDLPDFATAIEQ